MALHGVLHVQRNRCKIQIYAQQNNKYNLMWKVKHARTNIQE